MDAIKVPIFHSNEEAIFAGLSLVKQLFARLARLKTNDAPEPEDGLLNIRLDTWFELIEKSSQADTAIPLADIVHSDGVTQNELYMLLILLAVHFETGLKEACAAMRGHAMLQAPSPSLLMDLLFPTGIQKINLYRHGQIPIILEDKRYVILKHDGANAFAEPSVYLAPQCLQRLLALHAVPQPDNTYQDKFYHIETPDDIFLVFDEAQKAEILSICRQYCQTRPKAALTFLIYGRTGTGKHTFVRFLAAKLKQSLCILNTAQILSQTADVRHIALIFKEIEQLHAILLIPEIQNILQAPVVLRLAMLTAISQFQGIAIFTSPTIHEIDQSLTAMATKTIEMAGLSHTERRLFWEMLLKTANHTLLPTDIDHLATQFLFTGKQIRHAFFVASLISGAAKQTLLRRSSIEQACHFIMQKSFNGLTVKTQSEGARLDRLVLPEKQHKTFLAILSAARSRDKVMVDWGFGTRLVTGRGLCLLFDGPPGTGKTFAAEVLANELNRPLERVHLPNLVSKWVGETGENLAKLFAAATASNAILLLDEADALLSKRVSNGSKSSDRYANMEINILLQELERFNGISILTTNLEKSLDEALERRVQFRITFTKPEAEERERLWRTLMSPKATVEPNINYAALATSYELAGGHIKNAILNAAYHACGENRVLTELDLREAATAECAKQGQLIQS